MVDTTTTSNESRTANSVSNDVVMSIVAIVLIAFLITLDIIKSGNAAYANSVFLALVTAILSMTVVVLETISAITTDSMALRISNVVIGTFWFFTAIQAILAVASLTTVIQK